MYPNRVTCFLVAVAFFGITSPPSMDAGQGAQHAKTGNLYRGYFPKPTGRNGYEEYLQAADLTHTAEFRAYSNWWSRLSTEGSAPPVTIGRPPSGDDAVAQQGAEKGSKTRQEAVAKSDGPAPWPPAPPGVNKNSTLLDVQRQWVKQCGRIVDLIKAGNLKPAFDPRTEIEFSTSFPELSDFKTVVKFLCTAAYVQYADGNSTAATDTLLQGFKFMEAVGGQSLIHTLVQYAGQALLMAQINECLPQLSEKDAKRVVAEVDDLLARAPVMVRAIQQDKAMMLQAFSKTKPSNLGEVFGYSGDEHNEFSDFVKKLTPGQWAQVVSGTGKLLGGKYDQWIAQAQKPESQWLPLMTSDPTPPDPDLPKKLQSPDDLVLVFADYMMPSLGTFVVSSARIRTQLRLLKLHGEVIVYRWHNRRLPSKLGDAAPAADLNDPFSGEPFHFQFLPGGYRLFSKGFGKVGEIELWYQRPASSGAGPDDPPQQ